jgi:two-component system, NtrC family, sensor histidine kinase AtoS
MLLNTETKTRGDNSVFAAGAYDNRLLNLVREEGPGDYCASVKSAIIFLDSALRVKNINREAEKLFAVERDHVIGRQAEKAFQRLGEKFLKVFAISEHEEFYTANYKLRIREQTVYIHIDALKLRDSVGNLSGVILIAQDVSTIRATLRQIQTTQMLTSLGELAAGVAHHVRTPLTTISGYLQVMVNRMEDDQYTVRRDVLEMLYDEVSYINNVVKELILFAKPPVCREPGVSINRVLEEALLLTFKQLGGENITIDKLLAQDLPEITADVNLIKQALVNIMQNAVEDMPDTGTIRLRSGLHAELNMLVVAITDTGCGVALQIMPRVFEPFYTTKVDRLGLGLPTAYRIVSEHGGFINISSEPGSGTKVHVYLPVTDERVRHLTHVQQQILNLQ